MDLFKLRAVIGLDTSEYERGLKNSSNLFSKAAGGITKTVTAVGKAVAVGLGAAATAVGALVKQSVEAFADYEQLVGGVETLFGTGGQSLEEYADAISKSTDSVKAFQKANGLAADGIIGPETLAAIERSYTSMGEAQAAVLKDASEAYKTAGLSANAYMETVTGFSAALISSLGGDTATAAKYANQAIIDMSDNANKMGTDIESIQYAYQGFAKQNYTMLDNLKLGYGGTKSEMERLLKDAEKLTGKKFDVSNFADITEAIHAIQTEMGITGTTAEEASTTISGSIASMKASWENLLVAISADDLPFDQYVKDFAESVTTVAGNLIPRIGIALQGVASLVSQLAPIIGEQLPGMIEQLLPPIIAAATNLFASIVAALPGLIEQLLPPIIAAATSLVGSVTEVLPGLIEQLLPPLIVAATSLINSVVEIFPELIGALVGILPSLLDGLVQIVNAVIEALPSMMESIIAALPTLIPALVEGLMSMIVTLCSNLFDIIRPIIDYMPEIIYAIVTAIIAGLPELLKAGGQLLLGLLGGMIMALGSIPEVLVSVWHAIVDGIKSLFGIHSPSTVMAEIGGYIMQGLIDGITALLSYLAAVWESMKATVLAVWNAIASVLSTIVGAIANNFTTAWNSIKNVISTVINAIKDVISTTFNAIKTIVANVMNLIIGVIKGDWGSVKTSISNIINAIKSVISSVWNNIGAITASVVNGIKDTVVSVWNGIKSTTSSVFNGIKSIATSVWNGIKTAITTPIENAKTIISGIVDDILGFFDVKITWPDIPMPHFSIKPKGWGVGDLLNGTIPSLGIDWYAKAMNNPMLLRGATIFGMQDGQLLGGGEAGGEVVAGANTVSQLIYDAVRSAMGNVAGGIVVNQNIYSEAKTAADLMQEARWEAERAVLTGV